MNEWYYESLINQRHLLAVLVSYLFIHDDRPKPAKVPAQKHTFSKIRFNYRFRKNPQKYWNIMFCQYCTRLGQTEMFCQCFTMYYSFSMEVHSTKLLMYDYLSWLSYSDLRHNHIFDLVSSGLVSEIIFIGSDPDF